MIEPGMFDRMVIGLVLIGMAIGLVLSAIGAGLYYLFSHLTIGWIP